MQYMMIICDVETEQLYPGDAGFEQRMAEYGAFTTMVQQLGIMRGGGRLQPTTTATTVRLRNGRTLSTDGPFAETKEQFGGFYLLDCKDLDQALALAAQIPAAKTGSIEVRPLF